MNGVIKGVQQKYCALQKMPQSTEDFKRFLFKIEMTMEIKSSAEETTNQQNSNKRKKLIKLWRNTFIHI